MKKIKICIIGLGYVGLPLAINFAKKNFFIFGIDNDLKKINHLRNKKSYLSSLSDREIINVAEKKNIQFTNDYSCIKDVNYIIICLPTPLKKRSPDLSFLIDSIDRMAKHVQKNQTIILESTSYPGTTKLLADRLSLNTKLISEKDFFFGFSPERENPGGELASVKIPKVISAFSHKGLENLKKIYGRVFKEIVLSSKVEEAEAAKLLENCFRSVNISLINELRDLFNQTDLDIWKIIEIAKTKPFGFMPFYPSVGAGGHCIPVDPVYLSWFGKKNNFKTTFIDNSIRFNQKTPIKIANLIAKEIKFKKANYKDLIIFGVTYKKNVNDIRESSSLKILKILYKRFNKVSYYDSNIKSIEIDKKTIINSLNKKDLKNLKNYISIITVNHDLVNYNKIFKDSFLIFDCVNKFSKNKKIISI